MVAEPLASYLQPGTDPDVAEAYASLAERALTAVFGFEEELAFVDLETTGFDPSHDEIIEMAVVLARGPDVLERWSTLVRPRRRIPREAFQLTGIDDDLVSAAPPVESAATHLAALVGARGIVAHNAAFDRAFLERAGLGPARLRGPWLDSLELARIGLPRMRSHRLTDLARAFGLPEGRSHRAPDDAEVLFRVWRIALAALADLPPAVLHELARMSAATPGWPASSILAHLAAGVKARPFDLRQLRTDRLRAERHQALADACEVELAMPERTEVLDEFGPEGVVGRMYDGYETRSEQARMAEAVLEAFGSSRCAAVEAGTGVGKSVAYLVPAARFALKNGVPVGVATKTNTLMDQLMHRELPRLADALGEELRYTALKGYEHYVCLRKLQRLFGDPPDDAETAAALGMLLAWTAQSSWGDKEAVNLHWPPTLRGRVLASVADCTKKRCRFFPNHCYLHGVRRRAGAAHIVVTNHALLFRDLSTDGGILPPIRHWIVDEAHAAEAEARDQLSVGTGHAEVRGILSGLHAKGRGGYLDALRGRVALERDEQGPSTLATIDEMRDLAEQAMTIADSFFDLVKDLGSRVSSAYDRTDLRVTLGLRETGAWGTVAGVGRSLSKRLETIVQRGRALVTALEADGDYAELRADLVGQLTGLAEQIEGLATVLDGTDERFVYSVTVDRRRDQSTERLDAFLLDVGAALAEQFYPKVYSVVYTSATVATGNDFSHFARAVGLDRTGEDGFRALRLESSYDFERQMAVFVPTDIPEPCQPTGGGYAAYLEALTELLFDVHVAMGGSVLTLFTNRRDMDELFRRLVEPLDREGLRLLVQSRGVSRKRVADEFVADERVSLFATKSFWEGFDAKGDTLRCVVVPRLPFGPVNDPVLEERRDRDAAWWEHYYLPEAVLELKQAAGRLIRSRTDEGCLVLADSRLVGTKQYVGRFLESLPVSDVERLPAEDIGAVLRARFGR